MSKYASMAAEDLKEGSNLFDNVNARIVGFKFSKEAPDGYTVEGNPIFAWVDLLLDGEGPEDERKVNQSYSLGGQSGDNYTISDDGFGLIPAKGVETAPLRKDSKWGTFTSVAETSGIPKPVMQEGDMGAALIGLYGHFKRVADKERNFGDDQRTKPGQQKKTKFPPSTLVCVKIHALPGQAAVKPATGAVNASAPAPAAAPSAPATSAPTGDDLDLQTAGYLETVLKSKGGSAQRSTLTLLISKAAMAEPNRQDIARRATDENFLKSLTEAGIVSYDPASKPQTVSLPKAA